MGFPTPGQDNHRHHPSAFSYIDEKYQPLCDPPTWVILTSNKTTVGPVVNQLCVVSRSEYDIDSLHTAEPISDCGAGAVVLQSKVGRSDIVNTHHAAIDMATARGCNPRQVAGCRTVQPLESRTV